MMILMKDKMEKNKIWKIMMIMMIKKQIKIY